LPPARRRVGGSDGGWSIPFFDPRGHGRRPPVPSPRAASLDDGACRMTADRSVRIDERAAEQIADTMFALSTPSRVQILGCLLDRPRSVKDLTETLGMEQSAVSHQLRVLRDHALVTVVERVGRRRVYGL